MSKNLFVGNLPFDTTESQIREIFEGDGRAVAEVRIINDRETGRPRGFAFVEMGSGEDARAAMSALDGTELDGRALRVNEANERKPGGSGERRD